jgi:hypothetical protein
LDNMYHVDAHDVLRGSIYARIREGHLNLQWQWVLKTTQYLQYFSETGLQ